MSVADQRGYSALTRALEQRRAVGLGRSEPDWHVVRTPERYLVEHPRRAAGACPTLALRLDEGTY